MAADATHYPEPTEYAPYYWTYVSLVPKDGILATLSRQKDETLRLLRGIPESREQFRYAPGKWSVRELAGHVIDAERVFSYRALRISRNDKTPLPGFEQEPYIEFGNYDARPLATLADELSVVRQSTILLFMHLTEEAWLRRGVASNAEVSVRALAYIIAGHELHHMNVLRTKYL